MVLERAERILGAAEHASEPGHDLLPFELLAPGRILGASDILDHGEVAQAQDPARPSMSSWSSPVSRRPFCARAPPAPTGPEAAAARG